MAEHTYHRWLRRHPEFDWNAYRRWVEAHGYYRNALNRAKADFYEYATLFINQRMGTAGSDRSAA